jgi:hypothetical protein
LARHSEYLDGVLSAEWAEQMTAHLASCADCARYDRVLRRGVKLLQAQPVLDVPAEFLGELQYRIAAEERRALRPVSSLPAASLGVAAMLAFLAMMPVFMMRSSNNATAAPIVPASAVATEIAWHGENAVQAPTRSHVHLATRRLAWAPSAASHVIEPKYTPVILESPTAPPRYSE